MCFLSRRVVRTDSKAARDPASERTTAPSPARYCAGDGDAVKTGSRALTAERGQGDRSGDVPYRRAPKLPRPGRMYLRSFRHRSRAPVETPSGAATIEGPRASRGPPSLIAMAAHPPLGHLAS